MKQFEEIIVDEGFIDWVNGIQSEHSKQWVQWMQQNPQYNAEVEKAVAFHEMFSVQEKQVSAATIESEKNRLLSSIETAKVIKPSFSKYIWWSVAACFLLVVSIYTIQQTYFSKQTFAAHYGEIATQILPDGSKVILNSNSSVKFGKDWQKGKPREVWIEGEAFFEVQKTDGKQQFIVHAKQFDVIVTGTKFNVVNRANASNVLLKEGSVTLQSNSGNKVKMIPGEFAHIKQVDNNTSIEKEVAKEEELTLAWVNRKLYFENADMKVVAQKIKDLYGVEVRFANEEIKAKLVSGILPNESLDVLLQALEATYEFKISRKNADTILIEPNY